VIEFRGKKVSFESSGQGPAVVLLHGFLENRTIWKNFARRLSTSFRVITIDLPGFGESDHFADNLSIDDMAETVHAVLKSVKVNSCVMAGHSMGGYVTLAFAEKYPRMLRGFVLFHSHAGADSPEAAENRERTIAVVEKDHHGFIKNFIPGLFDPANVKKFSREIAELGQMADKTPKEGIIAALRGMKIRPDRQHVLMNAKVPVLFIIGKNDSRVPLEVIMPQALLPAHSEVLLLDHTGHMGFIEAKEKTFSCIKSFAARLLLQ